MADYKCICLLNRAVYLAPKVGKYFLRFYAWQICRDMPYVAITYWGRIVHWSRIEIVFLKENLKHPILKLNKFENFSKIIDREELCRIFIKFSFDFHWMFNFCSTILIYKNMWTFSNFHFLIFLFQISFFKFSFFSNFPFFQIFLFQISFFKLPFSNFLFQISFF